MTQVFLNLVMNAIRYTPPKGLITIQIQQETSAENRSDHLLITVTDTGPGMSREHLPRLFERFYRTDEARDRNGGGMGLGLAIAKGFVQSHDGTIDVESTPLLVRLPLSTT